MERDSRDGPRHVNIGLPLSLVFVPLLFIAAGIAIPFSLAATRFQRRRRRKFQDLMKARHRAIGWKGFVDAMDERRGTLIVETALLGSWATLHRERTFLGHARWWWTPDSLYAECPHPIADWLTMREDANFDQFSKWCHQRYTNPETGSALLIAKSEAPAGAFSKFCNRLKSGGDTWVEVVPFDLLPQKRRSVR
jgi:hypothetical protein